MLSDMGHLSGTLSAVGTLEGSISVEDTLSGGLTAPEYIGGLPYTDEYIFTPSEESQTVSTAGKILAHNIVINPIPSNYGKITWNGSVLTVS